MKIGFIGLGNMGAPMAINLAKAGHELIGYDAKLDVPKELTQGVSSKTLAKDADVVIFLYRPWVYSQEEEDRGKAEIIVSKQRNGPTGIVEATFIDRFARFENMSAFVEMEAESQF